MIGEMLDIAVMALLFANLFLIFYAFWKIRKVHLKTYEISTKCDSMGARLLDHFQQGQYLRLLEDEIGLSHPLPPTRGWAASPDFLLTIARYARQNNPSVIVECSSGVSTVVLAQCARLNGKGHVYSLEHDREFADVTRQNLERYGLADWATVIHAPLRPHRIGEESWNWYTVDGLPREPIDLLIVDGPPVETNPLARYPAGPSLFQRVGEGGAIFLDDAGRSDETRIVARWKNQFSDFDYVALPCEKGCAMFRRTGRSSGAAIRDVA